nr:cupin domain-containing protein [Rhodoferax sp.]
MAIQHAVSGEPVIVLPPANAPGERQTVALFKTNELEVMRVVLPAGKSMPAHKVAGDITVQCLEGSIAFVGEGGSSQVLEAGELLYLDGGVVHSLTGIKDACVLVHIVLRK